jgi:hypothetical protein
MMRTCSNLTTSRNFFILELYKKLLLLNYLMRARNWLRSRFARRSCCKLARPCVFITHRRHLFYASVVCKPTQTSHFKWRRCFGLCMCVFFYPNASFKFVSFYTYTRFSNKRVHLFSDAKVRFSRVYVFFSHVCADLKPTTTCAFSLVRCVFPRIHCFSAVVVCFSWVCA